MYIIEAVRKHAIGHIEKHRANVIVYLNNPAGIGEHSDIIEAIEHELEQMAKYQDQVDMLDRYFVVKEENKKDDD